MAVLLPAMPPKDVVGGIAGNSALPLRFIRLSYAWSFVFPISFVVHVPQNQGVHVYIFWLCSIWYHVNYSRFLLIIITLQIVDIFRPSPSFPYFCHLKFIFNKLLFSFFQHSSEEPCLHTRKLTSMNHLSIWFLPWDTGLCHRSKSVLHVDLLIS